MKENERMIRCRMSLLAALAVVAAPVILTAPALGDGIRIESLANARLALEDRDNQINPFDFGRNPAWLHNDYELQFLRFNGSLYETKGDLRREFDPHLINDFFIGVAGNKRLSDRQTVRGYIDYQRLLDREVYRNLEIDQYNDPFYLNDKTTGDFDYYGPRASIDWGFRLVENLWIGAGLDYNLSTGLKQVYTRPQIVHNYSGAILGLAWKPSERWAFGLGYRPVRDQNRTNFAKPDEGYDNVIQGYSGDAIYEVRAFSSYSIGEIEIGHYVDLQGFYMGDDLKAGLIVKGGFSETEVKYNASRQYPKGYWKEDLFDAQLRGRWTPAGMPLAVGFSARYLTNDGWGVRPDFSDVLLYDNPYAMYSAGLGLSYWISAVDLLLIGEYTAEQYDIEVWDNGANLYRKADQLSQTGRFAVEKNISNVYSFRAGYEYTDYPIDRWIKLPRNIDISRVTGGIGAFVNGWKVDLHVEYGLGTADYSDQERQRMGAAVWFTKYMN
jgi:hypothetical protein